MTARYVENSRAFAVQPVQQTFVQLSIEEGALLCMSVWPNIDVDDTQSWSLQVGLANVTFLIDGKRSETYRIGPRGVRRTVYARTAEVQIATFAGLGTPNRYLAGSIGALAADVSSPWLGGQSSGFIGRFATEAKIADPFAVGGTIEWFNQVGVSLGILPSSYYEDWAPVPFDALSYSLSNGTILFRE